MFIGLPVLVHFFEKSFLRAKIVPKIGEFGYVKGIGSKKKVLITNAHRLYEKKLSVRIFLDWILLLMPIISR